MMLLGLISVASFSFALAFFADTPALMLRLIAWTIFVDLIATGALTASLFWWATNRFLRDRNASDKERVEWAYCFDVHLNSWLVLFGYVYLLCYILLPVLIVPHSFVSTLLANGIYAAGITHYTVESFVHRFCVVGLLKGLFSVCDVCGIFVASVFEEHKCHVGSCRRRFGGADAAHALSQIQCGHFRDELEIFVIACFIFQMNFEDSKVDPESVLFPKRQSTLQTTKKEHAITNLNVETCKCYSIVFSFFFALPVGMNELNVFDDSMKSFPQSLFFFTNSITLSGIFFSEKNEQSLSHLNDKH
jgi:hypothetical protein